MKLRLLLAAPLLVLIFGLAVHSKTPLSDAGPEAFHAEISGTYATNLGGKLYLQVDERGRVEGFYERGEIFGEVYGRVEGDTLNGYWLQGDAKLCESARHDASNWGRLSWRFDADGFAGSFNHCGREPDPQKAWSGSRDGV